MQSIVESAPVKRRGNPYRDIEGKFCRKADAAYIVDSQGKLKKYESRINTVHDKSNGQFAKHGGTGAVKEMPALEKANVVDRYPDRVKDPISGESFTPDSGAFWQNETDPELRAGGLWSETFDGMQSVRQVMNNRKEGKPDMENVDPERGWLKDKYQRVGEAQYGYNGARLGEVIQEGNLYSKEDMGVDIRNAATVLQHKLDTAPSHKSPLYKGMLMNRDSLPKPGDTFSQSVGSWAKTRETAEVFAYGSEAPSLGIIGDHHVVIRMMGTKKSADMSKIVGSGIMKDEHIAGGNFKVNRVTRKGKSVNIEVEQVND